MKMARIQEVRVDNQDIFETVAEAIRDITGDDEADVTRETVADDIDGWDSMAHVKIILAIEAAFKIRFNVEEVGRIDQVGDIIDMVAAKI